MPTPVNRQGIPTLATTNTDKVMKSEEAKEPRKRFDAEIKDALRKWPQTTEIWEQDGRSDRKLWLKAQPADEGATGPRLVMAGSDMFRTQPDGLYIRLSLESILLADCIAIEACSTHQNFNDKRSRYMPSASTLLLEVSTKWLNIMVTRYKKKMSRWSAMGLADAPTETTPNLIPVRFIRVLFFLKDELYRTWAETQVHAPHEYIASYSAVGSYTSQKMQQFLSQMSPSSHFYSSGRKTRE